jgi:hypothetical protein
MISIPNDVIVMFYQAVIWLLLTWDPCAIIRLVGRFARPQAAALESCLTMELVCFDDVIVSIKSGFFEEVDNRSFKKIIL